MNTSIIRLYTYGHWHISLCAFSLYLAGSYFSAPGFDIITGVHVFTATQFIYTFHRLMSSSRMIGSHEQRYSFVRAKKQYSLAILGTSGCIALVTFFFLPRFSQYLLVGSGILSVGYILPLIFHKRLRDIGVSKIVLISLVWAVISILSFGYKEAPLITTLLFVEHFFFIFALTIPFDVRDQSLDKKAQVSNLVNTIGLSTIRILMSLFVLAALMAALALYYNGIYSIELMSAFIAFYLVQFLSTRQLKTNHHGLYYLLYLDGLILLKGVLYIALSFTL